MTRVATITLTSSIDSMRELEHMEAKVPALKWQLTFDPPFATKDEEDDSPAAIVTFAMIRSIELDAFERATSLDRGAQA